MSATDCSADLFAIASAADAPVDTKNLFPQTQRITQPQNQQFAPALEVFAGMIDRVQSAYDFDTETAIYLWGPAAHPNFTGDALLLHVAKIARNGDFHRLREVLGNFVFILDDRRLRRITFITDSLGVRPWFVGSHHGQLVCGSDVLKICKAGLSSGQADYDAISCWLKYNYTLNGASVVRDYQKPTAAAVSTFDTMGQLVSQNVYGEYGYGEEYLNPDQMADRQVDIASRSLAAATRGLGEVNFLLSGGYDSRLLFALARRMGLRMHAQTIQTREYEVALAKEVAAAMRYPVDVVASRKRILDLFDDPFAFNGAGFPTGRNLTNMLARRLPGIPLVSGFLGDAVMRGPLTPVGDRWWRTNRQKLSRDEFATFLDSRFAEHLHRFDLMKKSLADNIKRRAMHGMDELVGRGQAAGKPLLYADLHARNVMYTANIILQHLDVSEAIVPYLCWEQINCRTNFNQDCYTSESYPNMFRRHFPELAPIRHSMQFKRSPTNGRVRPPTPASRHLRRFSADLAAGLALTDCLSGLRRKRILSLLPSGLMGEPRFQEEIQFAYKLQLFERQLRRCGVTFDWAAI